MIPSSVISSKGQVTVPREIRLRLGLKEGDRVEFVVEGGNTIIRPVRSAENPFEAFAGARGGPFRGAFVRLTPGWMKCGGTSGRGDENGDRYQRHFGTVVRGAGVARHGRVARACEGAGRLGYLRSRVC